MPAHPALTIDAVPEGRAVRLALTGELDLAEADRVAAAIAEHARPGGAVVLDLRALTFMDSTGLSTMITAQADSARDGWDLAVICDDGPVRRLFDLTDTRSVLRFVDASSALDG